MSRRGGLSEQMEMLELLGQLSRRQGGVDGVRNETGYWVDARMEQCLKNKILISVQQSILTNFGDYFILKYINNIINCFVTQK